MMIDIQSKKKILNLALEFWREADKLDDAFLRTADPRAIQGGACCEEADAYREIWRKLSDLYRSIE
jgi:hypothetical protein